MLKVQVYILFNKISDALSYCCKAFGREQDTVVPAYCWLVAICHSIDNAKCLLCKVQRWYLVLVHGNAWSSTAAKDHPFHDMYLSGFALTMLHNILCTLKRT